MIVIQQKRLWEEEQRLREEEAEEAMEADNATDEEEETAEKAEEVAEEASICGPSKVKTIFWISNNYWCHSRQLWPTGSRPSPRVTWVASRKEGSASQIPSSWAGLE